MSPYGNVSAPRKSDEPLPPTIYGDKISVHHINQTTCPSEVIDLLHKTFQTELERGVTYPQEGPMDRDAFLSYFLGADAFVGVSIRPNADQVGVEGVSLDQARGDRAWTDAIVGAYYVKPNYPGRSSHNCNAGFIVRPEHRGNRYGFHLGQSYLHYAPLLGYRASVFNLVYINNTASLRIWDKLGFKRVGLIPHAGRLKKSDGIGEEYVDAVVIWKSFVEEGAI